ncbi:MAG: BREX-2 system adenine-specific DNA-methyltransferase PglX [Opitutales bacterium]|nr:BREX-2 system adenine-specific DNA-methyltransferase PglX [Opitutales bacterium]
MIDSRALLTDLKAHVTSLEDDLRTRCETSREVDAPLREQYAAAKKQKRTAMTYAAWRDEQLTQVAVAWVLSCVFVRFLEDNELVEVPRLSGPGPRLQRARDEHELFFRRHPTLTEREYLTEVFTETGKLPGMVDFFDRRHNPLWLIAPSGDAASALLNFWRKADPKTGALAHDFTDPAWNTRFLGDLYQDLSEAARKRFALLQTPDFIEVFILDRTLTPAIRTFGYREVRLIDPTCGSGHFLLGTFDRLFRLWQQHEPGTNPRVLAQKALDGVYGVDLNPFAVAIARFRLLLAALQACGVRQLKNAPAFSLHLAVGDSLLHGKRFQEFKQVGVGQTMFDTGDEAFRDELKHHYEVEDSEALQRILGQQYHAVVGNPPYIAVNDGALKKLYKERYASCHGKWVLSVPFMERFFDLALSGSGEGQKPAGVTGQITSNSFMKREFGKKLIEEQIPKWDLTHVLDTSGASIPGHGTPTVILLGRNTSPVAKTVRTVMGIKGEPGRPDDPAKGQVWSAIVDQVDRPGSESEFVSAGDSDRAKFHKHPWSIGGGGAAELKEEINRGSAHLMVSIISEVGITAVTGEDDLYLWPNRAAFSRSGVEMSRPLVTGDTIRDWDLQIGFTASWLYDGDFNLLSLEDLPKTNQIFWAYRAAISRRKRFGTPMLDRGLTWYEWQELYDGKLRIPPSITFAFVATHNHFVLDRGGKVFKQSAPVVKLPGEATEDDHLRLLGLLNSATACFWMKQVMQGKHKGDGGSAHATPEYQRFEFDSTKLKQFPLPAGSPLTLARALDEAAQALAAHSPGALTARDAVTAAALAEAEAAAARLRARMIALQEELDWQCYRLYGLADPADALEWPEDRLGELPPLTLGERAFEIALARQMAAGELETTWFERHKEAGSQPVTELPAHWPDDYRALVGRRLAAIAANPNLHLIERPEFKRRWNTEPWAKRQEAALRQWLLARLEGYFFEGSRVCDLRGSFDPAAHGFTAARRPHLVTVNQLADAVQSDAPFLEAAEVFMGRSGFSVPKLVRELVEAEAVPNLPAHRYKETGLRKRRDWEATWDLQRREDAVEAEVRSRRSEVREEELKVLIREAQKAQVGDIPVPPKYASKDFQKAHYWKLRGKLDVPKERWSIYTGAERDGDPSPLIAWAGWDPLQQAQALAEYYLDAKTAQGWPAPKLQLLLAGLADLLPWLHQWHNTPDPEYGMGLGDYFAGFLEEECRGLDLTLTDVKNARFEN